jgi:hypothetical protein
MDFVTAQFQMSLQQILKNVGAVISDVREAINRRAARVHFHLAVVLLEWTKLLDFARVGIEKTQRHLLL